METFRLPLGMEPTRQVAHSFRYAVHRTGNAAQARTKKSIPKGASALEPFAGPSEAVSKSVLEAGFAR
jgi:hypothetical protein